MNKFFIQFLISTVLTLATVASLPASAQIEKTNGTGFAGIMLGYADPTNLDGRLGFGANVGMIFPNGMTGLLYLLSSTGDEQGVDVQIMHYGLGVDYSLSGLFTGPLGGLHAGARVGMATVDIDFPGAESDDKFSFGPALGYDWQFIENFSLGGEVDLLFSTGDNSYTTLYVLGTGKFWF